MNPQEREPEPSFSEPENPFPVPDEWLEGVPE